MNVTSKITVDMNRQNVGQRINAVQGDGNTRLAEITLLSGGAPWTPPEGVEAAIAYMQPGGTKGLYNKLADGTAAISISGNVATVILAPQMLVASGTVQASLVFNDAHLNRLTTFPFSVSVASNPSAGAQKVEDYIRLQWLEDKLDEYLRKAADSGEFDGKPGDNGVTFTPSVSENGDLSWRNNGGLPNPQTVNIRGPQGDSTAATAAANAAKTSAANAETHAAAAATSAAAAQAAVGAMGTELSQIKDDLSDLAPAGAAVGQLFRVAAISEDGKYTMEPVDMPSGGVTDVQVDGKTVVVDNVANIPIVTKTSPGITPKIGGGLAIDDNTLVISAPISYGLHVWGIDLGLARTSYKQVDDRAPNQLLPIQTGTIDYAVKAAMCDGKGEAWTDTERIAALLRMGCTVDDNGFVKWAAQEVTE